MCGKIGGGKMLDFVKKYSKNIHSQNGEDGIIEECIKRMDLFGIAVEFGGADGRFCSNTANLKDKGWSVYMYDINPSSESVEKKEITPENVNELPKCNVLSIDIDGNDYEVWKAYKDKPAIVVIEINSSLNPDNDFFDSHEGTNFSKMWRLGQDKGYFLLCHTGNLIFVDLKYRELFPEIYLIVDTEHFFNRSWLPKEKSFSLRESNGFSYR